MKKSFFIVAFATLSLVSCNKDWTCACIETVDGVQTDEDKSILLNASKENAMRTCTGYEYTSNATTVRYECTLDVKK